MRKAEALRQIADKANEQSRNERLAKHKSYVNKIVNGKCHFFASLGNSSTKVKVRKRYDSDLVIDVLVEQGFTVISSSKNGRTILTIKW